MAATKAMGNGLRLRFTGLLFVLFLANLSSAANYYVSVAGLGGAPDYESQFEKWAGDMEKELSRNSAEVHVTTLSGASATRQRVAEALSQLAGQAKPEDTFALFLMGHGTFDGDEYKLNLPGPDITGHELAALVNRISAKRQLIVNMTSCSGASMASFAKKDRIVITATKSGTEKNAPVFARYWVDALRDPAADVDKNGTITAQEAFNYAQRKTAAYFEAEKLLATEHPLMIDSAKVEPTMTGSGVNQVKSSLLAAAFPLVRPEVNAMQSLTPGKQRLLSKKEDLEAKIDRLKFEKAAMTPELYKQQLGALLLELAKTQAEIDR